MLTVATPVATDPLAAVALPGSSLPEADARAAFAQLLDQASVEQRQAKPGDAAELDLLRTLADLSVQPQLAEALPSTAPQGSSPRKVDTTEVLIGVQADTPLVSTAAKPDEMSPSPPARTDGSVPEPRAEDDAPPAELLAWVASLPLPPPAPAAVPAAVRADAPAQTQATSSAARPEASAVIDATSAVATTPAMPMPIEATAPTGSAPPVPATPAMLQAASDRKADLTSLRGPVPAATDGASPRVDGGAWLQALAAHREGSTTPARPATDNALPLPALPGHVASPLLRPPEAGTPLQAEVRAEVGSKEFAPALGSQLSVLVRNGIEHAQLKLNPAEMGPIEVRISIDGSQAQVDFSAAQAYTRQALQDAVPALATALRESGLTLTGGGVFEQPRESRGEASAHGRPPQAPDQHASDDALSAAALPRPRSRGVLDLYA